jgi:sugar phosphate isomerase/epimerase
MADSHIVAQMYTLRDFTKTPAEIAATMKKVREIGYESVQLSALGPIDPTELKRILDGEGLSASSTHLSYERMRDDTEAVLDEHRIYECHHTAVGAMPAEYRNAEGFHRFAVDASEVAKKLSAGGLAFSYHNHSFEFEKFGDKVGADILVTESDPTCFNMEIDTYWVQHGGGDPADWVRKCKGRIPLLHLKDMTSRGGETLMAEVGEGNLNWSAILSSAKDAGVEWYIIEQDTCQRSPFESLAISLRNLQAMGIR